jgi:tachykinin receptor 3
MYCEMQSFDVCLYVIQVVKMLIVVIVIFAVCWLPQNVLLLTASDNDDQSSYIQHIYLVFYCLAMSNSMYNPIIYCWMNSRSF